MRFSFGLPGIGRTPFDAEFLKNGHRHRPDGRIEEFFVRSEHHFEKPTQFP